ncbi:MAG: FHA domain-containing protein, partial [Myxococcota bacterium]|nr:FHA domain-containing protein [Myxococcota bacterium]
MADDAYGQGTVASDVALLRSRITVQKCTLAVVGGPRKGASVSLNRETIHIGRDPWCELVLEADSQVSGQHCEIVVGQQGLVIRDLSSRNGTFVDGVRIIEAHLSAGSKIQVGHTIVEVQGGAETHAVEIEYTDKSEKLVGRSPAMRKLFRMLERLGRRDVSVVFNGETGSRKTHIAGSHQNQSQRPTGPVVVVYCGARPASL